MAKKPTDKQLFKMKNEWLEQFYCVYNKKWFCCIVIDHVKRGGHCSEYEERKKKIDTP